MFPPPIKIRGFHRLNIYIKQEHVVDVNFSDVVLVGEEQYKLPTMPGSYSVYTLGEQDALLFVHEVEPQDVDQLLPTLDVKEQLYAQQEVYGIVSADADPDLFWNQTLSDNSYADFIKLNHDDFTLYTNDDNTVMLLDATNLVLGDRVKKETGYDLDDLVEGFCLLAHSQVMLLPTDLSRKEMVATVNKDEKVIDALLNMIQTLI